MTDSDQVTVAVASERTGIPQRTIRAWAKSTADRPPLLTKKGHMVSLAAVERVRKETGYKARKRRRRDRAIGAAEFAHRTGRTKATVYGWKKDGTITGYTERECQRMLDAIERKASGGHGLEEQAQMHQAQVEGNGSMPGQATATPGQLNYLKLQRLQREEAEAKGQLYRAKEADAAVRRIAAVYRESVDRLAVEVPRVVAAEFDRAGAILDPTLRASIGGAVQTAVLAAAPQVERELLALKGQS